MNRSRVAIFSLLALTLLAPLVAYWRTFGFSLSDRHSRWAEFGSAMGGIYSPIVALAAHSILVLQVQMQQQLNKHQFEQAYFAQARADIEFYATRLAEQLRRTSSGGLSFKSHLIEHFQSTSKADLLAARHAELARDLDKLQPEVLASWMAIYPALAGLLSNFTPTYQMTFRASMQKLIAVLDFDTCVALDHYHYSKTKGRLAWPYQFSPVLAAPP